MLTPPQPSPSPAAKGRELKNHMLILADINSTDVASLLARYDLQLRLVPDGEAIPGSYWGECEAGLVGTTVYARRDTPVHSLLHEAAHLIVLPPERRAQVHTDATDSIEEEDAVCVLQVLLGDALPGVGRDRVLADQYDQVDADCELVKRLDVTSLTQVEDGPENREEAPAADGDEG